MLELKNWKLQILIQISLLYMSQMMQIKPDKCYTKRHMHLTKHSSSSSTESKLKKRKLRSCQNQSRDYQIMIHTISQNLSRQFIVYSVTQLLRLRSMIRVNLSRNLVEGSIIILNKSILKHSLEQIWPENKLVTSSKTEHGKHKKG